MASSQPTVSEATKFGIVGLTGVGVQFITFNVLRYAGPGGVGVLEARPITAQVIAIGLATVVTYLGNRYWTYHHRERGNPARELPIFLLLNAIAIGIGAGCLAISHYALGLTSPLADNISGNVIGLGTGHPVPVLVLPPVRVHRRCTVTPDEDPATGVRDAR